MTKKTSPKKKKDFKISQWILHVQTTHNNTIVTLCDLVWNKVLGWWSGLAWFKGAKQNTPYAAEMVTKIILQEAKWHWLEQVWIIFKGIWMWREWVFKAINESGLVEIVYIKEATPIQFGGCKGIRPKRN